MPFTEQQQLITVEGTIQNVDLLAREMQVAVAGAAHNFDVPITCPVYVNDERVKMRLLQPGDHVWVGFTRAEGRSVAQSLRVCPP